MYLSNQKRDYIYINIIAAILGIAVATWVWVYNIQDLRHQLMFPALKSLLSVDEGRFLASPVTIQM